MGTMRNGTVIKASICARSSFAGTVRSRISAVILTGSVILGRDRSLARGRSMAVVNRNGGVSETGRLDNGLFGISRASSLALRSIAISNNTRSFRVRVNSYPSVGGSSLRSIVGVARPMVISCKSVIMSGYAFTSGCYSKFGSPIRMLTKATRFGGYGFRRGCSPGSNTTMNINISDSRIARCTMGGTIFGGYRFGKGFTRSKANNNTLCVIGARRICVRSYGFVGGYTVNCGYNNNTVFFNHGKTCTIRGSLGGRNTSSLTCMGTCVSSYLFRNGRSDGSNTTVRDRYTSLCVAGSGFVGGCKGMNAVSYVPCTSTSSNTGPALFLGYAVSSYRFVNGSITNNTVFKGRTATIELALAGDVTGSGGNVYSLLVCRNRCGAVGGYGFRRGRLAGTMFSVEATSRHSTRMAVRGIAVASDIPNIVLSTRRKRGTAYCVRNRAATRLAIGAAGNADGIVVSNILGKSVSLSTGAPRRGIIGGNARSNRVDGSRRWTISGTKRGQ